jgi:hypothetical protein
VTEIANQQRRRGTWERHGAFNKRSVAIPEEDANTVAIGLGYDQVRSTDAPKVGSRYPRWTQPLGNREDDWQIEGAVAFSEVQPEVIVPAVGDYKIRFPVAVEIAGNC